MYRVVIVTHENLSDPAAVGATMAVETALAQFNCATVRLSLQAGAAYPWWVVAWADMLSLYDGCIVVVPQGAGGDELVKVMGSLIGRSPPFTCWWVLGGSEAAEELRKKLGAEKRHHFDAPVQLELSRQTLDFLNFLFVDRHSGEATTQRKVCVRVGLGGGAVVTEALKLRLEEIPGVKSVEVGRWELPAEESPVFVD